MESPMKQYFPWHSLPTTLSRSQVASSLRDSSCASDDVSDLSLETINTALTNISSTFPEPGIPIPHTPKLHFKSPDSIYDFNKVTFDYETDGSREAAVEHVENSEHPSRYSEISPTNDDIFAFEDSSYDHLDCATSLYDPCDSASDLDEFEDFEDFEESSRAYDVDDVDFDDASHIAFENSVRFDTDVLYIESTEPESEVQDDAEEEGCQMTIHEMMMMMMSAEEHRKVIVDDEHHDDIHESDDPEETVIANMIIEQLGNDYPRDMVEIDRQIFIAFVNGIQGDTRQKYQARLHDRIQGFRQGRFQSPFFENETDSSGCLFLDEALKHVIGMFRHIVLREEFEELSRIAQSYHASDEISSTQIHSSNFLARIERLLSERLLDGIMSIGENELSFFADGVVYALGHPRIYMYD